MAAKAEQESHSENSELLRQLRMNAELREDPQRSRQLRLFFSKATRRL